MQHEHPIIKFAALILLTLWHGLVHGDWCFPFDIPTKEQKARARRRLVIHKAVEDAWAEAVARPTPRWLCIDGHPMTEDEAEEALIADRERWQQYLDTGRL